MMNLKFLLPLVIVLLFFILLYTFLDTGINREKYFEEIETMRNEITEFMKNDPESPFRKKGVIAFEGLNYFPVDPEFRVTARIERLSSPEAVEMPMTGGAPETYYRYARAHFTLKGRDQALTLFKSETYYDEPWLFLPFYDETSAEESYGGGRFLEVEYDGGKEAVLDFNKAYNPYCAYNNDYRCPIPPAENSLSVPVTAGEKYYASDH